MSFYEMLGELDDVLRLINLVDEGSVEDFGITQKSNELISRFIPIVDSWYELVQGGTYLSGDNDPSISAVDAQKT